MAPRPRLRPHPLLLAHATLEKTSVRRDQARPALSGGAGSAASPVLLDLLPVVAFPFVGQAGTALLAELRSSDGMATLGAVYQRHFHLVSRFLLERLAATWTELPISGSKSDLQSALKHTTIPYPLGFSKIPGSPMVFSSGSGADRPKSAPATAPTTGSFISEPRTIQPNSASSSSIRPSVTSPIARPCSHRFSAFNRSAGKPSSPATIVLAQPS